MFPVALHHFNKQSDRYPRGVAWSRNTTSKVLGRSSCLQFFKSVGGGGVSYLSIFRI